MDNNPDDWKRAAAVMAQENAKAYHQRAQGPLPSKYIGPFGREYRASQQRRAARMSAHARSMMGIES